MTEAMSAKSSPQWRKTMLREICERVDYGYTASAQREPIGPKFLRITDIVPNLIDWNDVPYCEIPEKDLAKYQLQGGDIVIARTGATTGYAKWIANHPESVFASYLVRIRIKPEHDNRFVGLVVQSEDYKRFIKANLGGAAQPQANAQVLTSYPILLPPLPTQRRIASILSIYDDLIENNTRRIKILEQMAQAIYREWFVEFRAPGVKLRKATLEEQKMTGKDRFPVGWDLKTFGEVALNFDSKRKPLSSMVRADMKGEYPYYGAAKIFDYINDYIFDGRYLLVAEDGSVITPDRKPVLQIATGKFWANNHTHIIQGKSPVSTNLLYLALSDFDIAGYVTGAAQPKITQANLNRIPIVVADEQLLDQFNRVVDDLLAQVDVLGRKNANLRQTRDLLLPRLVGGEIMVET